jgi:hypothetical protein
MIISTIYTAAKCRRFYLLTEGSIDMNNGADHIKNPGFRKQYRLDLEKARVILEQLLKQTGTRNLPKPTDEQDTPPPDLTKDGEANTGTVHGPAKPPKSPQPSN